MPETSNLVDASGWFEYLTGGPDAEFFTEAMATPEQLIVPAVSIYQVARRLASTQGPDAAFQAAALMQQGRVIPLSGTLALQSALAFAANKRPFPESVVATVAKQHRASFWSLRD